MGVEKVIWSPCFAHIRRKFFDDQVGDKELRDWMLQQMGALFQLEEEAWTKSEQERLTIRQEQEVPIIDEMGLLPAYASFAIFPRKNVFN